GDEGVNPSASTNFSGCNVSSRRPGLEPGGRRCNSCHPDHFWKAGRYKLAAPVSKTGPASPGSEHYRRLPPILSINPQPGVNYETRSPLSKPVALSQELQTGPAHPHPATAEVGRDFPPGASLWREAAFDSRPLAQKQSARPISGRP